MPAKLVSIIGAPASRKTTLARHLAAELPAGLIREDYAGNPFLAESYVGQTEARLPGQMYFLMSRVGQLSILSWPAEGLAVSDYGFCQDRIFARARLADGDFRLYERLARRVEGLVRPPDVLIHLDASVPTLLARIASRGREFEHAMDENFLSAMRDAYNAAAAEQACPVITVDGDSTDLRLDSPRAALLAEIRQALGGR